MAFVERQLVCEVVKRGEKSWCDWVLLAATDCDWVRLRAIQSHPSRSAVAAVLRLHRSRFLIGQLVGSRTFMTALYLAAPQKLLS
ncbi:MAG: hypothetical protein JWO95_2957 [Verrucomicrobiales bacterium]|nr:hypothetical protein [Verrucomicrobiales bacterium]